MSTSPYYQPTGYGGGPLPPDQQPVLRPAGVDIPPENYGGSYSNGAAVDLIRQKVAALYSDAPDSKAALQEIIRNPPIGDDIGRSGVGQSHRSRHQQYMYDLGRSGKSLAEIQAAWHQYYSSLPDTEKRQVWQEFYSNGSNGNNGNNAHHSATPAPVPNQLPIESSQLSPQPNSYNNYSLPTASGWPPAQSHYSYGPAVPATVAPAPGPAGPVRNPMQPGRPTGVVSGDFSPPPPTSPATMDAIRRPARDQRGNRRRKLGIRHHLQSLGFGLTVGAVTILIVLFSFFNEVIIAPFIQPSRRADAVPIIIGADGLTPTNKDEVIIPKINVEIPLDFSAKTIEEKDIDNGLNNGVIHYPTTNLPGDKGITVFFGHSSNNIFNPGKYKFAFVLLHQLEAGDSFYLTYKGTLYAYTVYDKRIIEPNDVSVLNPVPGKTASAALITCDPPGTSLHRLVVWGEQVSPDSNKNATPEPTPTTSGASQSLPDNGPTLWRRFVNFVTGKD